jgi:hypothetical protein
MARLKVPEHIRQACRFLSVSICVHLWLIPLPSFFEKKEAKKLLFL